MNQLANRNGAKPLATRAQLVVEEIDRLQQDGEIARNDLADTKARVLEQERTIGEQASAIERLTLENEDLSRRLVRLQTYLEIIGNGVADALGKREAESVGEDRLEPDEG